MSLSLAKKNIKHRRKTMKRKHGGGILKFMSSMAPFGRQPEVKKEEFVGVGNMVEAEKTGTAVIESRMKRMKNYIAMPEELMPLH